MASRLPPELLIEIFAFCAHTDALAPIYFSGVCSLWKTITESSARIWQVIRIDDSKPITASHNQAQRWIRQSEPMHFDVHVHIQSLGYLLPLLSPFLSAMHRWHSLSITGIRQEIITFSDSFPNFESLDYLSIFIDGGAENHQFTLFAPLRMTLWLNSLPGSSTLVPLRFTTVMISEESMSVHPTTVLDFLSALPQLEHFCLSGLINDDEHSMANAAIVFLPRLQTLTIRSTCTTRAILSHLHAPDLSELYLGHLNVDWSLPFDQITFAEGDSDDEAADFSRSPSSDRATGMGLRALINRSSPPLRVLHMDYADMRTKDFKFVFDRLERLEEFLIVASDMSDTVIRLFAPLPNGQVRLPKLRTLELNNCLRLSGDAIVECIGRRVRLTDRNESMATLSGVTIVECYSFTSAHAQKLNQDLGHRLAVSS